MRVLLLGEAADRAAGPQAGGAAGALDARILGRRHRDQAGHIARGVAAWLAAQAGVDHGPHARHGERGLGEVGRDHDARSRRDVRPAGSGAAHRAAGSGPAPAGAGDCPVLRGRVEAAVQRQDLRRIAEARGQRPDDALDLAHAGQKHQGVGAVAVDLVGGHRGDVLEEAVGHPACVEPGHGRRRVTDLQGMQDGRNVDDGGGLSVG